MKPCPFCGSSDVKNRQTRVECQRCLTDGPWRGLDGKDDELITSTDKELEDARERWNTRITDRWNTRADEDSMEKRLAEREQEIFTLRGQLMQSGNQLRAKTADTNRLLAELNDCRNKYTQAKESKENIETRMQKQEQEFRQRLMEKKGELDLVRSALSASHEQIQDMTEERERLTKALAMQACMPILPALTDLFFGGPIRFSNSMRVLTLFILAVVTILLPIAGQELIRYTRANFAFDVRPSLVLAGVIYFGFAMFVIIYSLSTWEKPKDD